MSASKSPPAPFVLTVEDVRTALGERAFGLTDLELGQIAATVELLAAWGLEDAEREAEDRRSAQTAA